MAEVCKCGNPAHYFGKRAHEDAVVYLCRRCYDYDRDVRRVDFTWVLLTAHGRSTYRKG